MPHITEGLLHAHLDGAAGQDLAEEWLLAEAHLGMCEDCNRRLAEARQIRDAAREIMGSASGPSAVKPEFDDLVAQAGVRSPGPRGQPWWSSTSRLAWAASLVLAVGAGWLGRELLIQTGQDVPAVMQSESVPQAPDQAILLTDALEADDDGATVGQTRVGGDDPVRVSGERGARGIAEQPVAEPDIVAVQESELQRKAEEFRQDEPPGEGNGGRPEDAMRAERERDVAAQLIRVDATEPTCYTVSPADLQSRLTAADRAVADSDGQDVLLGEPTWLRLAADGTVLAAVSGTQLSGTWVAPSNDSIHVLVADGGAGIELRLEKSETGFAGAVKRPGHAGGNGNTDAPPTSIRLSTTACESAP